MQRGDVGKIAASRAILSKFRVPLTEQVMANESTVKPVPVSVRSALGLFLMGMSILGAGMLVMSNLSGQSPL
ncbi:MAG: Uncharacterised protein [Prochlorococcus marinus str. MIT 9215]|jgi:hypothetical protein|nr:MAG: Uncharacterised protein [Prochlorococcus marinus str. MIT 9215]